MTKYRVTLSKVVHDLLQADVEIDAASTSAAMVAAVEHATANPDTIAWEYDLSLDDDGELNVARIEEIKTDG